MYGLQKGSELKEIIVRCDERTALRYRVAIDTIDIQALLAEMRGLEDRLQMEKPGNGELVEMGRSLHEFYTPIDRVQLQARLDEIQAILDLLDGNG